MLRAAAPPTSSPFGGGDASSTPPAGVPRPCFSSAGQSSSASAVAVAALRRANSGLQRQYSSSLQSQKTLQMPRQRSSRCCAIAETLELVSWWLCWRREGGVRAVKWVGWRAGGTPGSIPIRGGVQSGQSAVCMSYLSWTCQSA